MELNANPVKLRIDLDLDIIMACLLIEKDDPRLTNEDTRKIMAIFMAAGGGPTGRCYDFAYAGLVDAVQQDIRTMRKLRKGTKRHT